MRYISVLLILIVSVLGAACDNEIVDNAADFAFKTMDKESNKINLTVTIRYRLKSTTEKKLSSKYGRHYKDSLLLPAISFISNQILNDYSVGEIYNYKRDEIEQRLGKQTKTTFEDYDLELTALLIRSVGLSNTLMRRFETEHITRFQNAFNNCSKEIKAVITTHRDNIVFYEFLIENKNYKGMVTPEDADKVKLGDSLTIEYACEDPLFNRAKK